MKDEEKIINNESKKKKKRLGLKLFLIIFLVGNIGFYLQERAKWIYEGQPYPKAKEWLVPANMMLVYGTTLTKLPFIDERSFIMKPIIGLQDYFVSKWQENLPDDDAEKYLGWYMFRLRTYMVPNTGTVTLRSKDIYSKQEVKKANDKAWQTIKAMVKYEAKDRYFKDVRYTSFLNLSFFYMKNVYVYWNFNFNKEIFNKINKSQLLKFKKLYKYIPKIKSYYQKRYPTLYKEFDIPYFKHMTIYMLTNYLLIYQKEDYEKDKFPIELLCNKDKNDYLKKHFESKKELISLIKSKNILSKDIKNYINVSIDNSLEKLCNTKKIKNIKQEGERQWQTW